MKLINCGDSWAWGYELIDPVAHPTPIADLEGDPYSLHLEPVHYDFRMKHRYANLLANKINATEVIDLSKTGCSNQSIVRTLTEYLCNNSTDDIFVVIGWTSPIRTEFWLENLEVWFDYGPWFLGIPNVIKNKQLLEAVKGFTTYLHSEKQQHINYFLNIYLTETLLKSLDIKYVMFQCFYNNEHWKSKSDSFKINNNVDTEFKIYESIDSNRFLSKDESIYSKFFANEHEKYMYKWHPNVEGHKVMCDFIYNSCVENRIL